MNSLFDHEERSDLSRAVMDGESERHYQNNISITKWLIRTIVQVVLWSFGQLKKLKNTIGLIIRKAMMWRPRKLG